MQVGDKYRKICGQPTWAYIGDVCVVIEITPLGAVFMKTPKQYIEKYVEEWYEYVPTDYKTYNIHELSTGKKSFPF